MCMYVCRYVCVRAFIYLSICFSIYLDRIMDTFLGKNQETIWRPRKHFLKIANSVENLRDNLFPKAECYILIYSQFIYLYYQVNDDVVSTPAIFVTFEEIFCELPVTAASSEKRVAMATASLSVTQDGFHSNSKPIALYDSRCYSCHVTDDEISCTRDVSMTLSVLAISAHYKHGQLP